VLHPDQHPQHGEADAVALNTRVGRTLFELAGGSTRPST
jgi:hypothetical protein